MVVIEPEPETFAADSNPNPRDSIDAVASSSCVDASDGFETASEGEHDGDIDTEESSVPRDRQPQETGKGEETAATRVDSHEDALSNEEREQKAAAQANEAKLKGNQLFGAGKHEEALQEYECALHVTPEGPLFVEIRSICHANRAICFIKLEKYEDAIKECSKALELNPAYMKALSRRGEAHEKLEHFEEAIADMRKILELDPSNDQPRRAIRRLEPLADIKREKMKEEMIGKLKEMGNSVLGRFGMSVDNFKAVKDPNTGSYSISFQR